MGIAPASGAVIGALADDTSAWIVPHARVFGEGAEHNARGARDPLPPRRRRREESRYLVSYAKRVRSD